MDFIKKEDNKEKQVDYINILDSLIQIPFSIGKKLLVEFLIGSYDNDSIPNNNLDSLKNFGSLSNYSKDQILSEIDFLIEKNLIRVVPSKINRFWKVLELTKKGLKEITEPSSSNTSRNLGEQKNKLSYLDYNALQIDDSERLLIKELNGFLNGFNQDQKNAIISKSPRIICIAGAGSGKTTVLTKRIEFLIKYKGVKPEKILAITFTKKARKQMSSKLINQGISTNVHTFNSFCESILKKNYSSIYRKKTHIASYPEKILALNSALDYNNLSIEEVIKEYFSEYQRNNKTKEQLISQFMGDCFFVIDYFKQKSEDLYDFSENADEDHKKGAKIIYKISKYLKEYFSIQGLRDYTDQIIDALNFLKSEPENKPFFEHILVDEYQDVNDLQIQLLDTLNPPNFFLVGDPRQSIFGWRGSDIKYILEFPKKYPDHKAVFLKMNYRSSKKIIDFINKSISHMNLPDLETNINTEKESKIELINFESEEKEIKFLLEKINELNKKGIKNKDIFVLARTNKQLNEISLRFKANFISHIVRSDDSLYQKPLLEANENQITLATIHSIKGLEAREVFIVGCNEQNFPCKGGDHPVIDVIKSEDVNKTEEEKRLFYVALSRAKNNLYLTYTGKKPTYFITDEMKELLEE